MNEGIVSSREDKLSKEFELVVIGGGFHGACAFEQAAARGVDVLLVERDDFCSGASANSLKTVHGGIRFLQKGDIRRLRHSAKARQLWATRAPRLMRRLPCVLPLPRSIVTSAPFVRIGALGYQLLTLDRLSGIRPELSLKPPGVVSHDSYVELAAPFRDPDAKHALRWEDYQVVDSERLVMDTILAGERAGGHAINYVEALDIVTGKSVVTVPVYDRVHDREYRIQTRSVISFTGSAPGDSEFLGQSTINRSRPVLAANIVVNRQLVSGGVAFRPAGHGGASNRYLFCVPWQGSTILGTWYWSAPESARDQIEAHRLANLGEMLGDVNSALKGTTVSDDDVTRIHWGWLPGDRDAKGDAEGSLIKDPLVISSARRDDSVAKVVIEGTKFTTANLVAVDGLDAVGINRGLQSSRSISPALTSAELKSLKQQASSLQISPDVAERLAAQYGIAATDILDIARERPELAQQIVGVPETAQAEIVYCALGEQAIHLADVVFRRTGIGGADLPAYETLDCCARIMAEDRGWNELQRQEQIRRIVEQPYDGRWVEL